MILSKSGLKSINIDQEIDDRIRAGRLSEILLIVPTNRKMRYLKKEIISQAPNKSTGRINLETIGTFATKLLYFDSTADNRILSEASSAVLLKQGFQEEKLNYFSSYKGEIPHGTLERVKNVISEYKKQGITPELLEIEAESLTGSERIKAEDIARVFRNYEKKCAGLNVKEIGDVYREVNSLGEAEFAKRFRELYPDVNFAVINGFDEFTTPEILIINSAAEIKKLELFLSFDYFSYNPLMFSHLDNCYGKLVKYGFRGINDTSPAFYNQFQNTVRQKLFHNAEKLTFGDDKDRITKISAGSRAKEVELIAKEIKELILSDDIDPSSISVVFNLIKNYSPLIRDIFTLYGIPFNLTDRYPLKESSPVVSVLNFLEILENDFYYKNIFRALSSGYVNIEGLDQSNLLKVSVNLKVISGYENWRGTIKDAIAQSGRKDYNEENFNAPDSAELEKALNDVDRIYEVLSPFDKKMTTAEFNKNLSDLINWLNLPALLVSEKSSAVEKNVKAVTTFIDDLKELFGLFNLEFDKSEKFPLRFFLNHIRTAVSSSRYNIKEKPGYGVLVTNLNEIRGLKFDYLFIGGLCDGDYPTRYTPEIFFSGSYKRSDINHQTEERYRFYQSLCAWDKHLYLSSPLYEDKAELVQSNFLTEFAGLFESAVKDESDYSGTLYSKEELLIYAGEAGVDSAAKEYSHEETGIDWESAARSVEVNELRTADPFAGSEYTGFIKEDKEAGTSDKLKEMLKRNYSISQLETYAKCPYKYFAERILNLKPAEEPTEEIEAFEMGSLLHSILYKFYSEVRTQNIVISGAGEERFKYLQKLIFNIAEDKIEQANFNSPLTFYEKEKILGIGGDRRNSVLFKFLKAERENEDGFDPEYFETGFGDIDGVKSEDLKNLKADGVKIRGKIDRIDINADKSAFKVVDYKLSGRKPSASDITNGISLQLPLYMYAAKEMIKAQLNKDFEPAGAEIYSLKFKEDEFGKILIKIIRPGKKIPADEAEEMIIESNREMISICINAVKEYVQSISEGKFNLSTLSDRESKVCRFCQFRPICRIQEAN